MACFGCSKQEPAPPAPAPEAPAPEAPAAAEPTPTAAPEPAATAGPVDPNEEACGQILVVAYKGAAHAGEAVTRDKDAAYFAARILAHHHPEVGEALERDLAIVGQDLEVREALAQLRDRRLERASLFGIRTGACSLLERRGQHQLARLGLSELALAFVERLGDGPQLLEAAGHALDPGRLLDDLLVLGRELSITQAGHVALAALDAALERESA